MNRVAAYLLLLRDEYPSSALELAAIIVAVIAWFAILFTGTYPRWAFDFVVGVMRWGNRVIGYALVLVTDRYPPFDLE